MSNQDDKPIGVLLRRFAVLTDSGTMIPGMTMQAIEHALDAYLFEQRTGVKAMALDSFAQKAIGYYVNKLPEKDRENKKAFLSLVEKDFDNYEPPAGPQRKTGAVDAEFLKSAPKFLHAILGKHGHELDSNMLAYALFSESEEKWKLEDIKEQVRLLIHAMPDTFSIGAGASPKIVQLKDKNGKSTGKKAFTNTRKSSGGTRTVKFTGLLRWSDSTKNAFDNVGVPKTEEMLEQWRAFCHMHNIDGDSATLKDLIEFSKQVESE